MTTKKNTSVLDKVKEVGSDIVDTAKGVVDTLSKAVSNKPDSKSKSSGAKKTTKSAAKPDSKSKTPPKNKSKATDKK